MVTTLVEVRVDSLTVTVAVAEALDQRPHDVYLLEVGRPPEAGTGDGFDEVPVLQDLGPVLTASDPEPEWVVDVSRTHRSDGGGRGSAQVSVLLAWGSDPSAPSTEPDVTAAVQEAFSRIAARAARSPVAGPVAGPATGPATELSHDTALTEARTAVARLFPDVGGAELVLTDEEHHAADGSWSLGLGLTGAARFRVRVGLVAAAPGSVHVRRMPVGEVVDSVGT